MIRVYSDTDVRIEDPLAIYVREDGLYISAALFDQNREFDMTGSTAVMAILNLDKTLAVADVATAAGSVTNVVIGTFSTVAVTALLEGYYYVRVRVTKTGVPSTFKLTKIKVMRIA